MKIQSEVLHDFTVNLQKAVADTGLSPYVLARKIGVNKDAIKNTIQEDRDPQFSTVVQIAKGMNLSLDQLLGNKFIESNPPPSNPPPEVQIKKETINLIDRISKMHEQDIELLEAIAGILEGRRARVMAKFLNAVGEPKPPKMKKEGIMARATKKAKEHEKKISLSDDEDFDGDFEDSETREDEDFEDDEDEDYDDEDDYDDEEDYDENEDSPEEDDYEYDEDDD
jgi:DNA-binding XRE family transcriptional regulator